MGMIQKDTATPSVFVLAFAGLVLAFVGIALAFVGLALAFLALALAEAAPEARFQTCQLGSFLDAFADVESTPHLFCHYFALNESIVPNTPHLDLMQHGKIVLETQLQDALPRFPPQPEPV